MSNELSNFQILQILDDFNIKINGVCMKDQLPDKLKLGFYVINLQSSTQGNGTHWVALYYSPILSIYFDSFGFPPPLEVIDKIRPYVYNNKDLQHIYSTACGYYCIAFIKFLYHKTDKVKAYEIFESFFSNKTYKNDDILNNLLQN